MSGDEIYPAETAGRVKIFLEMRKAMRYYNHAMQRPIQNIAFVVLLFFGTSAFSPTYLSIGTPGVDGLDEGVPAATRVSIGVVWINILVSFFAFDDRGAGEEPDTLVAAGARNDDMVLVKKKRVVPRAKYQLDPILEIGTLPTDTKEHVGEESTHEYEIDRNPLQQETGVYISLNAGLSPPALLS